MLDTVISSWQQVGGYDGEHMFNFSKPYANGLWKYLRYYKNFKINSE
jgi:hypothetical protein